MIDFYFDVSSPWTYLAFRNIQPLAKELNVTIQWRPVLVGGIFNTVNQRMYASREDSQSPRNRYVLKDLQDCARKTGIKIVFPPKVFPVNSVKAMRGCIWLQPQGLLVPIAEAAFEAYWSHDQDISQDAVLAALCETLGIDVKAFFAGIAEQGVKDTLRANTESLIARGGFGSPTIFVDGDMYFGNDRMPLIREALRRRVGKAA
jgi:2-hydroxychromene-2-carboxylate isomerase